VTQESMAEGKSGLYEINPAKNPAVLDTLTWDVAPLLRRLKARPEEFWQKTRMTLNSDRPLPESSGLRLYEHSSGHFENRSFVLLEDEDGQCALGSLRRLAARLC